MDQKYWANILKTTLVFAAIGAILVFAIPALANFLAIGAITSAPGQALFFGCFGALSAALTPVVSKFFDKPELPASTPTTAYSTSITTPEQGVSKAISTPTQEISTDIENTLPAKSFVNTEVARRNTAALIPATSAQVQ